MLLALPGIVGLAWLLPMTAFEMTAFDHTDAVLFWPAELTMPEPQFRILFMLRIVASIAIPALIGVYLAPRVALKAPVIEALLCGQPVGTALKPQILPAVFVGILGAALDGVYRMWEPMETETAVDHEPIETDVEMPYIFQNIVSILYVPISLEICLRWGMMSFFVWLGWRLVQHGKGVPRPGVVWAGIVAVPLLMGVENLFLAVTTGLITPLLSLLDTQGSVFTLSGVAYGWLYWRRGLEAAMIAQALTYVFLEVAIYPIMGTIYNPELEWHRSEHMLS